MNGTRSTRSTISTTPKRRNTCLSDTPTIKRRRLEFSEKSQNCRKFCNEKPCEVFTFGTGDAGQLGLGDNIFERKRPAKVSQLEKIIRIKSGGMHTVCLSDKGEVFTFGCNDEGALGRVLECDEDANVPAKVDFSLNVKIVDITAGDSHSTALTLDGKVYLWGAFRDNNGVIGLLKPNGKEMKPILLDFDKFVIKVTSGDNHVALLTGDGDIFTLGVAENGQLGRVHERDFSRGGRLGLKKFLTPENVRGAKSHKYDDLWAGSYCTIARATDGLLYGCGLNNYKQLDNVEKLFIEYMIPLKSLNALNDQITQVSFGQHHLMVLTRLGKVWTVGRGEYGSLGLGDNKNQETPQQVKFDSDFGEIASIAACNRTSYAIFRDGSVKSWGAGDTYMLGNGEDEDVNSPTTLSGKQLTDKCVIELSPGAQHVVLRATTKVSSSVTNDSNLIPSINTSMKTVINDSVKTPEQMETIMEESMPVKEVVKAVVEKTDIIKEQSEIVPEKIEAVSEKMEAVPEKVESVPEKIETVSEEIKTPAATVSVFNNIEKPSVEEEKPMEINNNAMDVDTEKTDVQMFDVNQQ